MKGRFSQLNATILIALAAYALCLGGAWEYGRRWEVRQSENFLRKSHGEFTDRLQELVHSVQWVQGLLVFDAMGGASNAVSRSVSEMRELADRFYIDELNIVDTNGIVIASNIPKVLGDDWRKHPDTAEFLKLLSPSSRDWRMSQPFRHGTINPEFYCTYSTMAFDDRSGLLEVGYSMDRLAKSIAYSDAKNIGVWRFGRYGHFLAIDEDHDNFPDSITIGADYRLLEHGIFSIEHGTEGHSYRMDFSFAGRLFAAVIPAKEFGRQRMIGFWVFAATSAVLIGIFAIVLFWLRRSAKRIAALRQEADARQAADLASAKTIQLSCLPTVDRYRKSLFTATFAAATSPAKMVGGDFYDFYYIDSSHLAFIVADASGKGISAAMFMMRAKNEIYNALCAEHDLALAVANANNRICENNEAEMFVTAWIGVMDVNSGEIEYVNAGHNRPFVRRADGKVEKVTGRGGRFLGTFPGIKYRVNHLALNSNDYLFVYTDGITEAMNVDLQQFGEARLCAALTSDEQIPENIIRNVGKAVCAHAGEAEQFDDLTAFALVWHGLPKRTVKTIAAKTDQLGAAMEWLRQEIVLADRKAKARLLNAADEIMTNIVNYSGATEYTMIVENAPGRVQLTFCDAGNEYNPLSHVDPNTHLPLEQRDEGGLGILMTKRLVDAVHYNRENGRNTLVLVKLDA